MDYVVWYKWILISLLLSHFRLHGENIPYCEWNYKGCCEGYIWNSKNSSCEVCMKGYHGVNCTMQCPFPTYGVRCQKYCHCTKHLCDVSKGCSTLDNGNTGLSMVTHGSNILKENSTSLITKSTSSYWISKKLSTENKSMLVLKCYFRY